MNKKIGVVSMLLGVAMIFSAIALIYYNKNEEDQAAAAADAVMPLVYGYIQEDSSDSLEGVPSASLENVVAQVPEQSQQEAAQQPSAPSTSIEQQIDVETYRPVDTSTVYLARINGYDYIGYISIPALDVDLPVMANWSYKRLQTAPCRYSGLHYHDNMVIAAHNYKSHFGDIVTLKPGDPIIFTDMQGLQLIYTVSVIEVLPPEAIDQMVNSPYDLTLFTCTYGGANRVTVRCTRVQS